MGLNWNEIKSRALLFSKTWADACNEDSEAKPFWIAFFEIFGITDKRVATFELNVKKLGGAQGFMDLFWPGVLLVEHKSRGKNLDDAVAQAVGYLHHLPERDLPQLVVVCDFARFRVRILATGETVEFELRHLHKHVKLFGLLAGYKVQDIRAEDPVNIKAAERMGRLHDALKASGYSGHALEVLLVRLLFCLFADDTGIFQPAQAFRDWVEERTAPDGSDLGPRLGQLFQVLNTPEHQRSKNIDEQLGQFAYVNGRLFEETLPMADFSTAMREALLDACALDWSAISPAIFGSLFQSIMDDKARRNLGAHYTSEANILKLIKPLFLDELHAEFESVKGHRNKLFEFHKKLRQLTFLDPACGCGNFLVISYRELRELELKVLRASHELSTHKGQMTVDVHSLIGVNVDQFYGMEIEEFPAQIAQVALWLVDHQMNLRVSVEFGLYFARIPLKSTPHIQNANALRVDWNEVLPAQRCSYVLGNPPFKGKKEQSPQQKADFEPVMNCIKGFGVLDFVAAWYVKSVNYIRHVESPVSPRVAFVSTNSIKQFRLQSNRATTNKLAATPSLFGENRQPTSNYLLLPKVSSENRDYLPIGFMTQEVIANGSALVIPAAGLFEMGVLQSAMHMSWLRAVCGRMKSDYQYSTSNVYNNFPWPGFTGEALSDKHRNAIEQAAQCVLDARAQFADSSLADLYDPLTMPPALLKAHQKLDTAVDAAYQPSGGKKTYASDAERVAFLFELYQRVTSLLPAVAVKRTQKVKNI